MANEIVVWDRFVRIGHWLLVIGFAVAYISEGEPEFVHSYAGYAIAAIVTLRIGWGFVGPGHARFADFIYPPAALVTYLRDLVRFRARRHVGHSPAGGAMVLALLASLIFTTFSGMAELAQSEGRGPLAAWLAPTAQQAVAEPAVKPGDKGAREDERKSGRDGKRKKRGNFKDIHEFAANLTLILVVLHIGGVALASLAHRENLVRAMITGRKRPETDSGH